jgi:hypothetical protein
MPFLDSPASSRSEKIYAHQKQSAHFPPIVAKLEALLSLRLPWNYDSSGLAYSCQGRIYFYTASSGTSEAGYRPKGGAQQ